MLGGMGEGRLAEGVQGEVPGWEGGKAGRPPALLSLFALEELPGVDEALLRKLGLRPGSVLSQGLQLLRLATEAHKKGAELRWNTTEALKESLLSFLEEERNAKELLAGLGPGEKALLKVSERSKPEEALRRAVRNFHVRYHPRDLVRRLLKRLGSRLHPPDGLRDLLGACTPEAWAAATPFSGAFRGVFALLEGSYGLEAPAFERALAPCFVFAFLRGEGRVARPFREVLPDLTLGKRTVGLRYQEECWVARVRSRGGGPGELYEKPSFRSEKPFGPRIPSPSFGKALPGWYGALEARGHGECPEDCFPEEGYDWDLVAEYRDALWEAPASPGKGGKA
ncbi:hypothetical protein [Thermus sp.]|uniref:hypothetical protein n=1 Tax=Thermus sp. TaxID=275 RepID=UPI003D1345E8